MRYENFISFMVLFVIPRRHAYPEEVRLDGERSGGNRNVAGFFPHHGRTWKVHYDTRYEPLQLAYEAAQMGCDPFVEEETPRGTSLVLVRELRAQQRSRYKYLYIYADC